MPHLRNQGEYIMQDKIEKTIELKAPIARVWRALTDHTEFGQWFQVALESPFVVGETCAGNITYPGYEYMRLEATVTVMDKEKLFSFDWCPLPGDLTEEEKKLSTSVEFRLRATPEGTHLTIIESGFAALPDNARRDEALGSNTEGWEGQTKSIAAHVES